MLRGNNGRAILIPFFSSIPYSHSNAQAHTCLPFLSDVFSFLIFFLFLFILFHFSIAVWSTATRPQDGRTSATYQINFSNLRITNPEDTTPIVEDWCALWCYEYCFSFLWRTTLDRFSFLLLYSNWKTNRRGSGYTNWIRTYHTNEYEKQIIFLFENCFRWDYSIKSVCPGWSVKEIERSSAGVREKEREIGYLLRAPRWLTQNSPSIRNWKS